MGRKKKPKYIGFFYRGESLVLNNILEDTVVGVVVQLFDQNRGHTVGTRISFKSKTLEDRYRKDPKIITKFVFRSEGKDGVMFVKFKRYRASRIKSEGAEYYITPVTPLEACVMIERNRKTLLKKSRRTK